jgi:hypothetical protein
MVQKGWDATAIKSATIIQDHGLLSLYTTPQKKRNKGFY